MVKFSVASGHRSTIIFPVSKETLRNLIPVIVLNYLPILSLSPPSAFMETCGLAAQTAKSLCRSLDARFTLWFHNKITQSMEGKWSCYYSDPHSNKSSTLTPSRRDSRSFLFLAHSSPLTLHPNIQLPLSTWRASG